MAKRKTFDSAGRLPETAKTVPAPKAEPAKEEPKELAPVDGITPVDLGDGLKTEVPIYMRRMWGRKDVPGVTEEALKAGPVCLGTVTLREGVSLNLLLDAVRDGFASDKPVAR